MGWVQRHWRRSYRVHPVNPAPRGPRPRRARPGVDLRSRTPVVRRRQESGDAGGSPKTVAIFGASLTAENARTGASGLSSGAGLDPAWA